MKEPITKDELSLLRQIAFKTCKIRGLKVMIPVCNNGVCTERQLPYLKFLRCFLATVIAQLGLSRWRF